MLYRALSLSFLLSSLISAGDTPKSNHTVEMVDPTPQNPPQMPKVEFENPYATRSNNGGGGNSPSGVGSNTAGSVLNFLGAVADYIKGPQPDYDKMRRDTKNQKFIECISKYGPHTSAQFYPEETAAYMQKQSEREWAELFKQQAAAPKPAPVVATPAPVVSAPVVTPTPTPSVSAPVVLTPKVHHCSSVQVINNAHATAPVSTPSPAVSTPVAAPVVAEPVSTPTVMPAPAVSTPSATSGSAYSSSFITGLGTGKAIGGIQGTTQLQMPTMNQLTPPKNYIKPLPVPPTAPGSGYTGPQAPSSSQSPFNPPYTAPTPAPSDSLEWGKVLQDAGEGAAIALGAMAVVYVGYKTGEGLYNGSKWLYKKLVGETEKQVVQQVIKQPVHANLEFHQNPGHCQTPPKSRKKTGCLKAEVQPGDPRTRGLADIEFPADSTHIFRDEWGHFVHDTPETRNLLRECYKKGTYHGFDGAGNHQFSMANPKDGSQLWVKIREGGRISTAGCNEIHLPISKETGFLYKPDCWNNPSAKGVGCTFLGGLLPTMSSQVAKANIPEAVLFPVDQDPNVGDLNFFPFYYFPEQCETYRHRYRSDFIQEFGMPAAPEGYYFEPVKNEGLLLPPPPIAVTAEEVKAERASKMSYAIRMKKKNMEDYVIMEEMRRRNKQEAKVLKNAFFKKDSL